MTNTIKLALSVYLFFTYFFVYGSEIQDDKECISLKDALSYSLIYNPELQVFSIETRVQEALVIQAKLIPNPDIEIEVEDFGRQHQENGVDFTESTFRLSQLIELGGKRRKRTRASKFNKRLSDWSYSSKRLDILTGTTVAFVNLLYAQNNYSLAEDLYKMAQEVFKAVSEKVEAGKITPLEKNRSQVELSTSEIELGRAKRLLESAKKELAFFWGEANIKYSRVCGDFDVVVEIPDVSQLLLAVMDNPDLARWDDEMAFRRAMIRLEKAQGIPDLLLSAGVRRYEETDEFGLVFRISIPIQIFNRNQGNILSAKRQLAQSQKGYEATDIRVRTDLIRIYQELSMAYMETLTLRNDILPNAKQAFDAATEGFREGKFEFLDVLTAQRTFFTAKQRFPLSIF